MPPLCTHHRGVYSTRRKAIVHLPHGHKALAREARVIARQCPNCSALDQHIREQHPDQETT